MANHRSTTATAREQRFLAYLISFMAKHGRAPLRAESAAHFKFVNAQNINYLMNKLESKGYIKRVPESIEILRTK